MTENLLWKPKAKASVKQSFGFKLHANREPVDVNEGQGVDYLTERLEVEVCRLQLFI